MAKVHGPRIKAARGYAGGISTAELGSRIGVSESTIKRWEAGDPSLTVGYRIAIADVCGIPAKFMEQGWGVLEPTQIERLLDKQTDVLEQIRDAVREQKALRDATEEMLPQVRAILEGHPLEDQPAPPPEPQPTGRGTT